MKPTRLASLFASLLFVTTAVAQVPSQINYQGRVTVGGTNFSGAGQFKFALVNSNGIPTYWSNNGTSVNGSEPSAAVALTVTNGLYSLLLGDAALSNMTAIPATVFTNGSVWLRIWFNGGSGSQLLVPDQRIAAVGYAMMAAGVPDGSITAAKIASNAVTSSGLADVVSLGASNAYGRLDVYYCGSSNTIPAVSLIGQDNQISTYGDDGLEQARIWGPNYGEILLNNSLPNNATAAKLTANAAGGGYLSLNNTNGSVRAKLSGENVGGYLNLYSADGQNGAVLDGDASGSGLLYLYNTNGAMRVALLGQDTGGGGGLSLNNSAGSEVVELMAYNYGGGLTLKDEVGTAAATVTSSGSGGGYMYLYNSDGDAGLYLDGDSSGAGYISVRNTTGSARLTLEGSGSGSGGEITLLTSDADTGINLIADSSGAGLINVMNTAGSTRLALDGSGSGSGGQVTLYAADGDTGINLIADNSGGGLIRLYNTNAATKVYIAGQGASGGGELDMYSGDGGLGLVLMADSGGAGILSVRNSSSANRVWLDGESSGSGGEISVYDGDGDKTVEILGAEVTGQGAQIALAKANGTTNIYIDADYSGCGMISIYDADGDETVEILGAEASDQGAQIKLCKADGTATIYLDADYDGDGRITTQELEITGGSDLSEQFDINAGPVPIEPGMVVCIDANHPGELTLSRRAYDPTVAGIVSGAGSVKPGLLMGQRGTRADGKLPVALSGRVYCLADAARGAIRPGDLLTTSDTPGHAMKAADPARVPGAILGKAMTALESGQGLVLVLVSLQ